MIRLRLLLMLAVVAIGGAVAAAPANAATWQLVPVPAPGGQPGQFSLGSIGDLKLIAPNRGILTAEGTSVMPRGIYAYDGVSWRVMATVCGGTARRSRIAVAGPQEFWVIADTNPSQPTFSESVTLCRFKDGGLTSLAVPATATDNWQKMQAATCVSASECWFGGESGVSNDGVRSGAFHIATTDGAPRTVYAPFQRWVNDLEAFGGTVFEGLSVDPGDPAWPNPLVRIGAAQFTQDTFGPDPAMPDRLTRVLALDAAGTNLWAGGFIDDAPNTSPPQNTAVPLAAVLENGEFRAISLTDAALRPGDRVVDIAAVPGTTTAWAAIEGARENDNADVPARVALIDHSAGVLRVDTLPAGGTPRGTARRIDCIAVDDCWLTTAGGWLWHLTDGTPQVQDSGFFPGTITARPRDGRSPQVRPDTPPVDDSLLFAAAPEAPEAAGSATPEPQAARSALIARVRARLRGRRTLVIRFTLRRRATVRVIGSRGGKVVARSARRTLKAGQRSLTLRVKPRRYPTKIRFETRELDDAGTAPSSDDSGVVTTSAVFLRPQGRTR